MITRDASGKPTGMVRVGAYYFPEGDAFITPEDEDTLDLLAQYGI